MHPATDSNFRHHLYDTLILLGARKEIADLLKKSEDYLVTEQDIDDLRRYNAQLCDKVKDRLANLNTIKIRRV